MLAVDSNYFQNGIGTQLLIAAETRAKHQGYLRARVEILEPRDWIYPFKKILH